MQPGVNQVVSSRVGYAADIGAPFAVGRQVRSASLWSMSRIEKMSKVDIVWRYKSYATAKSLRSFNGEILHS